MTNEKIKLWNDLDSSSSQLNRMQNGTASFNTIMDNFVATSAANAQGQNMMPPFTSNFQNTLSTGMNDVALLGSSQFPTIDDSLIPGTGDFDHLSAPISASALEMKTNEFRQCLGLDYGSAFNDSNSSRPQFDGNSLSHRSNTHVFSRRWDAGGVRNDQMDMNSVAPFDGCDKIDRNFLTLGIGCNSETTSNLDGVERDFLSRLTPDVQNSASTLNLGSKTVTSFPQLGNNVGGVSSPAQNAGAFSFLAQNAATYSSPSQNMDSWSMPKYGFGVSGVGGNTESGFGCIDRSTGFQGFPAAGYPFPASAVQSGEGSVFAKGKGLQLAGDPFLLAKTDVTGQVAGGGLFQKNIQVQPNGNVGQSHNLSLMQPSNLSRHPVPPHPSGNIVQLPSLSLMQPPDPSRLLVPRHPSGGSKGISHKRPASQIPTGARPSQRRARATKPSTLSSVAGIPQKVASPTPLVSPHVQGASILTSPKTTAPSPTPAQTARRIASISRPAVSLRKMQGSDRTLKPGGWNCFLCKRDLLFTPTGPVSQPRIPPAAAVLPCGHYFHDECLQNITTEDQSGSPPCIPCAIGDN